ncbi:hypothetical protein Pan181_50690 [Aeoliella mucimassa]|uniref:Uncharacterized protein n=1 Tax=Aeoliella mucimassa TaxID=2527972 RepID=A0A518AVQ7_9BACT|nr:hypothetical protein Pan181_50690 [Aeoliella mucimassa]
MKKYSTVTQIPVPEQPNHPGWQPTGCSGCPFKSGQPAGGFACGAAQSMAARVLEA